MRPSVGNGGGDAPQRFPNKIKPPQIFSSPPIFTPVESSPSRPRIHLTMRCQARRGRRRGSVLSQAQIPGPLQRSPSGRGAGNEGDGVGCSRHRIPRSEGRASEAHRQGAHAVANITRRRGDKDGGDGGGSQMIQTHPPGEGPGRHGAPSGGNLPGHRPGYGRHSARRTLSKPDPTPGHPRARPEDRRRLARETHAAGKDVERGAGRSHIFT